MRWRGVSCFEPQEAVGEESPGPCQPPANEPTPELEPFARYSTCSRNIADRGVMQAKQQVRQLHRYSFTIALPLVSNTPPHKRPHVWRACLMLRVGGVFNGTRGLQMFSISKH